MRYLALFIFLGVLFNVSAKKSLRGMGVILPSAFKDNGKGREQIVLDYLIKDCLKTDYTIENYPYGRHINDFPTSSFDFVTTIPDSENLVNYKSMPYIKYMNGVSTKSSLKISSLKDLKGKRVISFSGAKELIPELRDSHKTFATYIEKSKQDLHTKMLLADRVDAVISDAIVFHSHTYKLLKNKEVSYSPLSFHHILKETEFVLYFKKKELRDRFNVCVKEMISSGKSERFKYEFYVNELFNSLESLKGSTKL